MDFSSQIIRKNKNESMPQKTNINTDTAFRNADRFQRIGFLAGFFSIGFVLVIVLGVILSIHEMRIDTMDITGIQVLNEGVSFNIEYSGFVENQFNRFIEFRAWCIIPGKETRPVAMHALLRENTSNVYYVLPTSIQVREDVTAYLADGVNYDNSGFIAYADCSKINHQEYEIFILYECASERFLIPTGQYVDASTGEMK